MKTNAVYKQFGFALFILLLMISLTRIITNESCPKDVYVKDVGHTMAMLEFQSYRYVMQNLQTILTRADLEDNTFSSKHMGRKITFLFNTNKFSLPKFAESNKECNHYCHSMRTLWSEDEKRRKELVEKAHTGCDPSNIINKYDKYVCEIQRRQMQEPYSYQVVIQHTKSKTCAKQERSGKWQMEYANELKERKYAIEFRVYEYNKETLTFGGSTFRATTRERHTGLTKLCAINDTYTGYYIVSCPYIKGCLQLTITRLFSDFIGHIAPLRTVSEHSRTPTENTQVWNETYCTSTGLSPQTQPGWRIVGSENVWFNKFTDGVRPFSDHSDGTYRQCFKRLGSLTLLGDSHMRYFADYIFLQNGDRLERDNGQIPNDIKAKHDVISGNIAFRWTGPLSNLTSRLTRLMDEHARSSRPRRPLTARDVYVLGGGSWDLLHTSLANYVTSALAPLVKVITRMRSNPSWKNVRVIWVNNIAFPDNFYDKRNRATVLAANGAAHEMLREHGIEEVDVFELSDLLSEHAVYTHHYLGRLAGTTRMVGDVGLVAARTLLQHICEREER